MRAIGMVSLAGLILTGLSPTPIASADGARPTRTIAGEDPDARCAPFLRGFAEERDAAYGRGRGPARPYTGYAPVQTAPALAPPPPPPPSSPPPVIAQNRAAQGQIAVSGSRVPASGYAQQENRERYAGEAVAAVRSVAEAPVSTFSIDVDTGSYANVRRMLNAGTAPPRKTSAP